MGLFLWVDPGVRKCGYALIDKDLRIVDAGIILQDKKNVTREDNIERMGKLFSFFSDLFAQHDIASVSVEKIYFTHRNQANAEFVYGMRGAILSLVYAKNIALLEYTPLELKRAITGKGSAAKQLMQTMIQRLFSLHNMPDYDDAADALWLAYLAVRQSW